MTGHFDYLASPYTHPERKVVIDRFLAARNYLIWAFAADQPTYSPIVHWHHIASSEALPSEFEHWLVQDDAMVKSARQILVLDIPGWKESRGVTHEIAVGLSLSLPIYLATRGKTLAVSSYTFSEIRKHVDLE